LLFPFPTVGSPTFALPDRDRAAGEDLSPRGGLKTRIPLLDSHRKVANSNFAEVGIGARDLIPDRGQLVLQTCCQELFQTVTFGIQAKNRVFS
jgi:hypothetical protein